MTNIISPVCTSTLGYANFAEWKSLGHPYESQNFKFKIQQKTFYKKNAEIRLDIPKILLFMKNHLKCVKNVKKTCNFM